MAESKSPATAGGAPVVTATRSRTNALERIDVPEVQVLRIGVTKEVDSIALEIQQKLESVESKPRITRPYEENVWVHACVKAKGQARAHIPLQFWVGNPREDKGATLLPKGDPLWRAFSRPTPNMTQAQFSEAGTHHRMLDGEGFWALLDAKGKPVNAPPSGKIPMPKWILPLRGACATPDLDPTTGWPRAWRFLVSGRSGDLVMPIGSMVHFRDYNIDDPLRGLGDTEVLVLAMDLYFQAEKYQRTILQNGGDPGGFIITERELGTEEHQLLEKQVNQQFLLVNAGKWKSLSGKGVQYVPNKIAPKDMEFKTLLPWLRDVICGVLGVPPPILGVLENATLNNAAECVMMFWEGPNGILPLLTSEEDVITNMFLRDLDHPQADRLFAVYDTKRVKALQDDKIAQLNAAIAARTGLNASPNEACKLAGMDVEAGTLKFGDEHIIPAGQTTIDAVLNPPDPEPTPPPTDPATDPAKAAGIVTRESTESDTPAADPAAAAPTEDIEATKAAARREYWGTKEANVIARGEAAVRSKYRQFRKDYLRAQLKRIRDFAAEGDAALRSAAPITKDDPPTDVPADDGFSKPSPDPLLLNQREWVDRMTSRMHPPLLDIWANSIDDLANEINSKFPLTGSSPEVLDALKHQVIRLSEGHNGTLAEQVRKVLLEELSKPTSTGTLQQRVAAQLEDIEAGIEQSFAADAQTRANTIARTETASAMNNARNMEMKRAGIKSHTWVTSKDNAVRGTPGGPYEHSSKSHFELDGKSAQIGVLFDPANHPGLAFPHSPAAAADDTINCRCVAQPDQIANEENP